MVRIAESYYVNQKNGMNKKISLFKIVIFVNKALSLFPSSIQDEAFIT